MSSKQFRVLFQILTVQSHSISVVFALYIPRIWVMVHWLNLNSEIKKIIIINRINPIAYQQSSKCQSSDWIVT